MKWLDDLKVEADRYRQKPVYDGSLPVQSYTLDRLIVITEGAVELRQLLLGNDMVDFLDNKTVDILYDFCRRVDGAGPYAEKEGP